MRYQFAERTAQALLWHSGRMDKDEAFVLHALWEMRVGLAFFAGEHVALEFNIQHDPRHIRESIAALLERGLIEARDETREGAGALMVPAAVLDMMQGIASRSRREMTLQNRRRCVLGLTEAGGAAWEALFRPCWEAFVSAADSLNMGGQEWHSIGAFNRQRLEAAAARLEAAAARLEAAANAIEGVTARLEISPAAAGEVVYWKNTGGWRAILMDGSGAPLLDIDDDCGRWGRFHEALGAEMNEFYENMDAMKEEVFVQ